MRILLGGVPVAPHRRVTPFSENSRPFRLFGFLVNERVAEVSELSGVPAHLIRLLVLVEDKRFWFHPGTDPIALLRAAYMWAIGSGGLQGGSTISEQLVKIRFKSARRTLVARLVRMAVSLFLELGKNKVQLLHEYLDSVYLGRGSIGFDAAAMRYFGKPICDVTRAEAFFLVERVAFPAGLRPARLRNILLRRRVQEELGRDILSLPSVYLQVFSSGSDVAVRSVLVQVSEAGDAR